ncbi:Putative xaa-Pro dipeptidyl-peptidase-like domain, cocE/Serine esterase, alpha/Beta hydrolase [Septoria linicola]|uniref:Xaa-Pro dipeptidyl-peptidase-like domain, cocE/Serine esterase, alpha/Beta hydrolase n=1 Tax=Septoria linicola TaxID=215465 RepID=A0A9Q9EMN4_9PEZI|nr:Putative xaa-Pro dipeptidyl-peptidase-like domain, cocE/Serine esterase, alpha/Beta hydrolase [Septoria linicola]
MTYIIGGNEVLHKPTPKVGREGDRYQGFSPGSTILQAGHRKDPSLRAFEVDTIFERDIEVPLRDGTILRADVFRPHNDTKLPALMSWSPYGKSGSGMLNLSFMPGHAGLSSDALSGYERSSKRQILLSSEEGKDEYDAVEYIAQLPWCTGSVGIVGNSWLAMAPYHIASQQPPHLKCFAPLEGASDLHRETHCRSGIPQVAFASAIAAGFSGRGQTEDLAAMLQKYPD